MLQLFSTKVHCSINSSWSHSGNFLDIPECSVQKWWFCDLRHNSVNPKLPKNAIMVETSQFSKCFFSATTLVFHPCAKSLIFMNFRKNCLDISRSSSFLFSETTALISSIKVSTECFTFVEEHLSKKSLILILASESKESENSKNAINNVSSLYSNSCFSKTTGLITVIEISLDNYTNLKKHSIRKSWILILASKSLESENTDKCS